MTPLIYVFHHRMMLQLSPNQAAILCHQPIHSRVVYTQNEASIKMTQSIWKCIT